MTEETIREQIELAHKNISKWREAIQNEENRKRGLLDQLQGITKIPQVGQHRLCTYSPQFSPTITYVAQIEKVLEEEGTAYVHIVHVDNPSGPIYAGRTDWAVDFDEIGHAAEQVWRAKA